MNRLALLLAVALVATAPITGCLGDDGSADTESSTQPQEQADEDQATNETGEDGGSTQDEGPTYEERTDTVEGEILGAGANGCGLNVAPVSDQPAEFDVPEDTEEMELTLTLDGSGEVCANLYNASASPADGDEAEAELATSGQEASWSTTSPEAGTWTVYLYGAGTGPTDGTYAIDLTHRVLVSGGSGAS